MEHTKFSSCHGNDRDLSRWLRWCSFYGQDEGRFSVPRENTVEESKNGNPSHKYRELLRPPPSLMSSSSSIKGNMYGRRRRRENSPPTKIPLLRKPPLFSGLNEEELFGEMATGANKKGKRNRKGFERYKSNLEGIYFDQEEAYRRMIASYHKSLVERRRFAAVVNAGLPDRATVEPERIDDQEENNFVGARVVGAAVDRRGETRQRNNRDNTGNNNGREAEMLNVNHNGGPAEHNAVQMQNVPRQRGRLGLFGGVVFPGQGGNPAAGGPGGPAAVAGIGGLGEAGDVALGLFNDFEEDEEWRRRLDERQERETVDTIAREVARLRRDGIPEEDFELIRVPVRVEQTSSLTLRRICIAVFAVVTAFVCTMIRTMELLDDYEYDEFGDGPKSRSGPGHGSLSLFSFPSMSSWSSSKVGSDVDDSLLYELMELKDFRRHVELCGHDYYGPGRSVADDSAIHGGRDSSGGWWMKGSGRSMADEGESFTGKAYHYHCDDGVIHIPTLKKIQKGIVHSAKASRNKSASASASSVSSHLYPHATLEEDGAIAAGSGTAQALHNELPVLSSYSPIISADGVNVTWRLDCNIPSFLSDPGGSPQLLSCLLPRVPLVSHRYNINLDSSCPISEALSQSSGPTQHRQPRHEQKQQEYHRQCFRGVHDGIFNDKDIDSLISVGSMLIGSPELGGGNHLDVRYDVNETLIRLVPSSIMSRLKQLLQESYGSATARNTAAGCGNNSTIFHPVAFRFTASVSPIPANHRVNKKSKRLENLLNKKAVENWMKRILEGKTNRRASLPSFSFFSTLSSSAGTTSLLLKADPCTLKADMEENVNFVLHTLIFLTEKGYEEDYTGGSDFYIQESEWNDHISGLIKKRQRKYNKGLVVDGSRGRVIVSTGGLENLRCKLPTKAGVRAVLQIWWGYFDG